MTSVGTQRYGTGWNRGRATPGGDVVPQGVKPGQPNSAEYNGMVPDFAHALMALIDAAHGAIWINSGYRSDTRQVQLWNEALAKYGNEQTARNWVAKPESLGGKGSNHTHGMAADLGGDLRLAHQLAPQFGLLFPLSNEDWHIEPTFARDHHGADYAQTHPTDPATGEHQDDSLKTLGGQLANLQGILGGNVASLGLEGAESKEQPAAAGQGQQPLTGAVAGDTKGNIDPATLYKALRAAGLDPAHAAGFVAVSGRESGWNTGAYNPNASTGDDSHGLFQINKIGGMHAQYSNESLHTLEGSVAAAADMYHSGGVRPWGPYKGESWLYSTQKFWDQAAAASGGEVSVADIAALQNEGL